MRLDARLIGYINTFESLTGAHVKDCFFQKGTILVFVVLSGYLGKAVGKNGIYVKKISHKLGHHLRIIEFNTDAFVFVRNIFHPLKGFSTSMNNGKITISTHDRKLLGKIYGRNKTNLKISNEIIKRYFKELEIVVNNRVE